MDNQITTLFDAAKPIESAPEKNKQSKEAEGVRNRIRRGDLQSPAGYRAGASPAAAVGALRRRPRRSRRFFRRNTAAAADVAG